jgi:putative transcription factor
MDKLLYLRIKDVSSGSMQECDICGRKTDKEYVVEIEEAQMHVCERCAKGMTPIEVIDHSPNQGMRQESRVIKHAFSEAGNEIASGYGGIIKNAREKAGLTNKDLAIKINEKESLIARIERNQLIPEQRVVKKLEKLLGIKLETEAKQEEGSRSLGKNEPLTLWDAAIKKESKKNGGE